MVKSRLLWAVGIAAVSGCVVAVSAQAPAGPAFAAASIKPNRTVQFGGGIDMSGARLVGQGVTVEQLVRAAYADPARWLPNSSIVNEPKWMSGDTFDVAATADDHIEPGPSEQKRLMLRTLLADRFHLVLHRETRDGPRYTLVVARSDRRLGPGLHPTDTGCDGTMACTLRIGLGPVGTLWGHGQPLTAIVNAFSRLLDEPVTDQTQLDGLFDLDMQFDGDALRALRLPAGIAPPSNSSTDVPSLFTAVQDQLDLKLEAGHGPVDVLVIDHVEHPTEN